MIHSKSLIRRLAYVPWLLAFGLVLGWAGEAQAQNVQLTVPAGSSLREDGGAKTFTVTATNYSDGAHTTKANVSGAKVILLTVDDNAANTGGLSVNYTVTSAVITIPDGKDTGTAEITVTPIVVDSDGTTNGANADFVITLDGEAGNFDDDVDNANADAPATITFIDTHKNSSTITLSLSPAEISQEAGPTEITATGTLNGERITRKNISFPLIVVGTGTTTNNLVQTDPGGTQGVRDTDYTITGLGNLTIPRKKASGTATFVVDPSKVPAGSASERLWP